MAISVTSTGTTTLTGSSTEDSLYSSANAGVFVPNITLINMALGDIIRLRVYKYDSSGGTLRLVFDCEYTHVQGIEHIQCPMIDAAYGMKFTATQIAGTGRSCKWFISQLDA